MTKTYMLHIRLKRWQIDKLSRNAEEEGCSISVYVRDKLGISKDDYYS